MTRRFVKVSEEEIVAINEAAFFIHLIWYILIYNYPPKGR